MLLLLVWYASSVERVLGALTLLLLLLVVLKRKGERKGRESAPDAPKANAGVVCGRQGGKKGRGAFDWRALCESRGHASKTCWVCV